MNLNMWKSILLGLLLMPIIAFSYTRKDSKSDIKSDNDKAYALVKKMVKKVGDLDQLKKKKDVIYTYSYITPDGKYDQSIEKYIFDGELSYGQYLTHQRTFPDLPGIIEQGYDGAEYWLKNEGKIINDKDRLKRVKFNRPTNYYWFTMMQKLLDPGLIYEYLGESSIGDQEYNIVKISFEPDEDKPSDIYQVYINKKTSLVDQFLFTVADFGMMEPKLMQVEYEKVDGIYIPAKRQYKASNWNADVTEKPWIKVLWTNVRFGNKLKKEDFKKETQMDIMKSSMSTTSLKSKLEEKKANFETKASFEKKKIYAEGIQNVADSGILESAINVGDQAPNFTLTNATGKNINLYDELKKGPVVLTWYRGGWCPYCNMTLHALQQELPNFNALGANLIALTPELPDNSISTAEINELKFEVLSDVGNVVAKEYGIVFELIKSVADSYNKSFNLLKYNGDDSNELPLAASYIIDTDGKVIYAFLDADYRNRAEPSKITKILQNHVQ